MSNFRVPHTLVLLLGMNLLAFVLTWVLPQGSFQRVENDAGREQVVAGSYTPSEEPVRLWPTTIFMAIPAGFAAAQDIIFFVFLIGGAFGVLRATGAADAMIGKLLTLFGRRPQLLVGGGMFIFAAFSASLGMAEEYLPFVPMLLILAAGLGFDAVTAVGILCVGYGVGYGVAPVNPFTVLIAQEVAGLQPTSGAGYRGAISIVFFTLGFIHVWRYAKRVQDDPSTSLVADIPEAQAPKMEEYPALTGRHILCLVLTLLVFAVVLYGLAPISGWHWYIGEMGAMFVFLTVLLALFGGLGVDGTAKEFCNGAAELTSTALMIGVARSILVVLEQGQVIDTIVHGVSLPLQAVGPEIAAAGMFLVQSVCNLFIPSGSGQAYVTMPIMAPLGDLVGVERQVAVLAYQFGDGFTNILVPTNAVLVGILAMANVPYDRWLRFILPFMVQVWIVGSILLAVAVAIGYS